MNLRAEDELGLEVKQLEDALAGPEAASLDTPVESLVPVITVT
jgi:hypothetical protein